MDINDNPRNNPPIETIECPEDSKLNPAASRHLPTYALINRASKNHESRYRKECLKIRACEMYEQGKGGGIVDLLLPKKDEEARRLQK